MREGAFEKKENWGQDSAKSFENSRFDNDKGVKEGGKADLKRDAKEMKAMKKKVKK